MNKPLELIDRFFKIIVNSESKQNQRLKSEWEYLHNLLKNEPISYDRIDAYLNILQQQNSQNKRNNQKTRKSEDTDYADTFTLMKNIQFLQKMMTDNNDKMATLQKIVNN